MPEQWRPVVGWEDRYEVSDRGRVKSLAHSQPGRPGVTMHFPGRLLQGSPNAKGYIVIALNRGTYRPTFTLHRLVLTAFVGPCPDGMGGCHRDDDKTNNALANLRWDTKSANTLDKVRNGRHPMASKTECLRGHAYTDENTYLRPSGARQCTCRSEQAAERYENRKSA